MKERMTHDGRELELSPDLIYEDEDMTSLDRSGLFIIQKKHAYRFTQDSVFLAHFAADVSSYDTVELGAGTGVISVLLTSLSPGCRIDAVEIQPAAFDLLERNIRLNGLNERIRAHCLDISRARCSLGMEKYSLAVFNPPYFSSKDSAVNSDPVKSGSRFDMFGDLGSFLKASFYLIKNRAHAVFCWPATGLDHAVSELGANRFAIKRARLIQHRPDSSPSVVLCDAVKNGSAGISWLPNLILYDREGAPTEEYDAIFGS